MWIEWDLGVHAHGMALRWPLKVSQSRSLFIRTMTVGPGITPGLLTLQAVAGLQALAG
jgi:hypothetical protein